MKKYLVICLLFAHTVKAEIYYPFADACSKELFQYCANTSNYSLPECILENEEYLSKTCYNAFMEYDRDRWTTWDDNAYEHWFEASREDRALYRKINWEEMKQRESGGRHDTFPKNPVAKRNPTNRIRYIYNR